MSLPVFVPFPKIITEDYEPHVTVLRRILNIVLELNPPLSLNRKWDPKDINALNNFKALYWAKYKQGLADYGLVSEELYVALGKELKEKSETEFNKLLKDLNDSQWTLILTGKITEARAIGKKIDAALAELFTKDGIVHGAGRYIDPVSKVSKEGLGLKINHFYLKDGQLHTIHIYGDSSGRTLTEVYIPKDFSLTKFIGGRMASVSFTNAATKQVIRASHILVLPEIQFDDKKPSRTLTAQEEKKVEDQIKKSMQERPPNAKGSRYIGQTGGPEGNGEGDKHAHLTIFKDSKSMEIALQRKYAGSELDDHKDSAKLYLGDFRLLVPKI